MSQTTMLDTLKEIATNTAGGGGGGTGDASAANQVTEIAKLTSIDGKITAVDTDNVTQVPKSTTVSGSLTTDGVFFSVDASKYTVAFVEVNASSWTAGGAMFVVETSVDNSNWSIRSTVISGAPIFLLQGVSIAPNVAGGVYKFEVQGRYLRVRLSGATPTAGSMTATAFLRAHDANDPEGRYNSDVLVDSSGNALDTTAQGLSVNLRDSTGSGVTLGQKTKASSLPVALASDQGTLAISGTVTANQGTANASPWKVDGSAVTQPISAAALPLPSGASTASNQTTANTSLASIDTKTPALASGRVPVDGSGVTQPVSGTVTVSQATAANLNNTSVGTKTNNNAVPGATNIGVLGSVANATPPTWTEGNQVSTSQDLAGNLRVYNHPFNALGYYSWSGASGTYAGLAANTPLFSMRSTDATKRIVVLYVGVQVITSVATSAAAITERQLIMARSFSASDTGGTAVTLTGNNQKRRTSQATSVLGDMRIGNPITAGTRTLDSAPLSSAVSWTPLNFTGLTIGGGSAGAATGAVWSSAGSSQMFPLLDARNGQEYPIFLAQNEGIVVRIGAAEPTSATQQTFITVTWAEVATDY